MTWLVGSERVRSAIGNDSIAALDSSMLSVSQPSQIRSNVVCVAFDFSPFLRSYVLNVKCGKAN